MCFEFRFTKINKIICTEIRYSVGGSPKSRMQDTITTISQLSDAAADNSLYTILPRHVSSVSSPHISGNYFILIRILFKNDEDCNRNEGISKIFYTVFIRNISARCIWTRKPCYFL
jgi:hypothetical protein